MPDPSPTKPQRESLSPTLPIVSGLLVAGLMAFILAWDWNWFLPFINARASAALGRKVTVEHLGVHLGRPTRLELHGLKVANPDTGFAPDSSLLRTETLVLTLDPDALWNRRIHIPQIDIDGLNAELLADAQGHNNWQLQLPRSEGSMFALELGSLSMHHSKLHLVDPRRKANVVAQLATLPAVGGSEPSLRADFTGDYNGAPIDGYFIGGSLLGLREAGKPYPVEAKLNNGSTRLALKGAIAQPQSLRGVQIRLETSGKNLADTYALTGIPIPATPPYHFVGSLNYEGQKLLIRDLDGKLGSSDIAGDIAVNLHGQKPDVQATLNSRQVDLKDLAGFIGAKPTGAAPASLPAGKGERMLPNAAIELPKLKAANIDLHYKAASIRGEKLPVDALNAHVLLKDGRYSFEPLEFNVGEGEIKTTLVLDGSGAEPLIDATLDFKKVDAAQLLEALSLKGGGRVGGRMVLKSRGKSAAEMLGRGNGEVQLFLSGGDLSALLVSLAGLDFGNSVVSLLGLPSRTDLRCLVADLSLTNGLLQSRQILADTRQANLNVDGQLNLSNETLDFRMKSEAKRFSVGSLNAPIHITGTLSDPKARPDYARLGTKLGVAAVAGGLLGPLGALLPTVQLGLGKDNDCAAVIAGVQSHAEVVVQRPARRKPPPQRHKPGR